MSVGQWLCDHLQSAPPVSPPPVPIALPTPAWIAGADLALGSLAVLVFAYGVLVANAAVNQWRRQAAGQRRALLAEEVLAGFYEAAATLQAALAGTESPLAQLHHRADFFAQLHARRFRFMSLFGTSAGDPFDVIFGVRDRLLGGQGRCHEGAGLAGDPIGAAVRAVEQVCRPVIDRAEA